MTLVLIHGYPFDHSMWDFVGPQLRQKFDLLTPDLPGFGRSSVLSSEPSIDAFADQIVAELDAKNVKKAVVGGMSMGGYVALSFSERYADRLAGLALISTQAVADTDEARNGRREMIGKVQRDGPQVAAAAAIPKLFAANNLNNDTFKKFPVDGAAKAGATGISWALEAMARRPDRTHILQQLKVPALVLHGSEDKFIPVERARQMAGQIVGAEFVEVPNVGHALPIEAPDACAAALSSLVDRATRL